MSANIIAASTPKRSRAVTVTSAAKSEFLQSSRKQTRSRTSRYSRMYLPACRISQTGVYGTGSCRQARINGLSYQAAVGELGLILVEEVSARTFLKRTSLETPCKKG